MKSSVDFSSVSVISTKLDSLVPFQTKLIDTLPLLLHSDIWRSWRAIETKLPGFYTSTMGETQSWEESWRPSGWVVVNGHICLLYPIVLVATLQCTLQLEVYDNGKDPSSTSKALYIYLNNDWRWLSRVIIYAFFKYGIVVLEPCKHGVWHLGGVLTPIQCTMTSCPTFWGERVRHDKSWRELVAPGTQLFGVFGMGPGIPMDY